MLIFKKYVLPCFLLLFATSLHAFVFDTKPTIEAQEKKELVTVEQFIAMTPASMEATTGKKMGWGKKQLFKITQKRIKKRLAKGEVQLNDLAFKKKEPKRLSLSSLVFGIVASVVSIFAGLLFLAGSSSIGWIIYLSAILLALAAAVLGIYGHNRENKRGMAIIGIVLGATVLLPALRFLVVVLGFFIF